MDRGVGRRLAEVVGEDAAGVGDDPDVQHLPVYVSCQVAGLQESRSWTPNPATVCLPFWHTTRCECQRVSDPPTCGPFVSPSSMYMAPSRMGA